MSTSAIDFLKHSSDTLAERGKAYDSEQGERSMDKTVTAFNAITGKDLTEAEGWLLLQTLKDVRQWQKKDYHHDSALDCVAYSALKAEALAGAVKDKGAAPAIGDFIPYPEAEAILPDWEIIPGSIITTNLGSFETHGGGITRIK